MIRVHDRLLRVDIDRDLNEITKLINSYMNKAYIQDIERELENCTRKCEEEGCREMDLLRAVSAFMAPEQQKSINKIAEMMYFNRVIGEIMPKLVLRDYRRSATSEEQIRENVVKLLLYKILLTMKNR